MAATATSDAEERPSGRPPRALECRIPKRVPSRAAAMPASSCAPRVASQPLRTDRHSKSRGPKARGHRDSGEPPPGGLQCTPATISFVTVGRRRGVPGMASWLLPVCALALKCLVLCHQMLQGVQGVQPMLGACLSWAVDRDFRLERPSSQGRTVAVTVRSAFKMASTCNYTLGERVSCRALSQGSNSTSCQGSDSDGLCKDESRRLQARAVMAEHGVLCVGQVVETTSGSMLDLIHTTGDTDVRGVCASDATRVLKTRRADGSYAWAAASGPSDASSGLSPQSQIGKVNNFHVTALHTQEDPFAIDRRIQGMDVAVGVLVHVVHVQPEAVALVAWLAYAWEEERATDMLMPHCSDMSVAPSERAGKPCRMNLRHSMSSAGTGAEEEDEEKDTTWLVASGEDKYWEGLAIPGVPPNALLKTFVPLCCVASHCGSAGEETPTVNGSLRRWRNESCATSMQEDDAFNFNSPVPEFPLLVQVPATSDALASHPHPHAPWFYSTHDPDGHIMTDVFLRHAISESIRQKDVRCYFGSTGASLALQSATAAAAAREEWPSRLCLPVSSRGEGMLSSDDALTCSRDDDCRTVLAAGGGGGEGGGGGGGEGDGDASEVVCQQPWSGCREYRDDASGSLAGNRIKLDFAFGKGDASFALDTNDISSTPRPRFTQHLAATLDYPGSLHRSANKSSLVRHTATGADRVEQISPRLSWQTSARSPLLFSAFACDAGTWNQPPIFVAAQASTDPSPRVEYTCPPLGPCEIPLYVRDFVALVHPEAVDADGDGFAQQSQDEITVEAALGTAAFGAGELAQLDGSACIGYGALHCIYRLPVPDGTLKGKGAGHVRAGEEEEEILSRVEGSVIVRCFSTLDLHLPSAAPVRRSCRSAPLCVKIRVEPLASLRGYLSQITAPRARLDAGTHSDESLEIVVDFVEMDLLSAACRFVQGTSAICRTLLCASNGHACEVVFDVPHDAEDMRATVAVANTDFSSSAEYVSGIFVGKEQIGGRYMQLDGVDQNCSKMSVLLNGLQVPPAVQAASTNEGKLAIRITTSEAVDCCPCSGYVLFAHVSVTWQATVASNDLNISYLLQPPSAWQLLQSSSDNLKLQYSISPPSAAGKFFRDIPKRAVVFKGFSASIIPREILGGDDVGDRLLASSHELLVYFRLAMEVGDTRLFGYVSGLLIFLFASQGMRGPWIHVVHTETHRHTYAYA
jgi:hypothetical protein